MPHRSALSSTITIVYKCTYQWRTRAITQTQYSCSLTGSSNCLRELGQLDIDTLLELDLVLVQPYVSSWQPKSSHLFHLAASQAAAGAARGATQVAFRVAPPTAK